MKLGQVQPAVAIAFMDDKPSLFTYNLVAHYNMPSHYQKTF